jgi:nucleotide-binding universal stress UspA family protein
VAQQTAGSDRFIVVGVDGSDSSIAALRWAIAQARLTAARVEAVTAWQAPATYGLAHEFSPAWPDATDISTAAAKSLAVAVAAAVRQEPEPPRVTTRVVHGHPAQVLTDAARTARLLVVGRRGHGAVADMLMGSVSRHCMEHARCPVVVMGVADVDPPERG